jgi:predicted Fe-Mo cluster-binding NifX family protein
MKIAISAMGATLDSEVDPRFGRCRYFIIVDSETMQFEAVENSSSAASGGAGIAAAQMIASKGVRAVLTGNCGPNAYQVLSSIGIEVITGVSGKVKDVIEAYRQGKYRASSQPNVPGHFGTGGMSGAGRGMGRGMGRGASGWSMPSADLTSQPGSLQQELSALKAQSQLLAKQLEDIQARISELEKRGKGKE